MNCEVELVGKRKTEIVNVADDWSQELKVETMADNP